ncbi:protein FAM227B [Nothoprocta perdicaria]|uniref:protein FAM227B n=1 Tax=Nothoprocta perdicaria TaxID=30464 RepID=UPI000E1B6AA7|nr:protein FAM227B [Nothoprocta perdicaria]
MEELRGTLLHGMSAPERLAITPDFIQQVQNMSCEDLLEDVKHMADGEISEDSELTNDVPKESETVEESCYIGPDPECRRVLFRLGGQSPLVSYYLKMHEIPNAASYSLTCKINRTEVYELPYPF